MFSSLMSQTWCDGELASAHTTADSRAATTARIRRKDCMSYLSLSCVATKLAGLHMRPQRQLRAGPANLEAGVSAGRRMAAEERERKITTGRTPREFSRSED